MSGVIEHRGVLVQACHVPGQRRQDGVAPAHPNGIQLSRRRFLLLISMLAFRGVDDARGIVYQIRDGDYTGPLLREGVLAESVDHWDPLGDGSRCVRQYGHPVAFGVPRGARFAGRAVPQENLFVLKCRVCARQYSPDGSHLLWNHHPAELTRRTQDVLWMQFRLNDAEDDLEILQPLQPLRQHGYEGGRAICQQPVSNMNQTYVQPIALDAQASQWADVCHFGVDNLTGHQGSGLAATLYAYDAASHRYRWTRTGRLFGRGFFEASLAPWRDGFVVAARPHEAGPIGWWRCDDPFAIDAEPTLPGDVFNRAPLSAYRGGDGRLRLFSGDRRRSPHGAGRNPLYAWTIDPERGFTADGEPQVVLDVLASGLKISPEHGPIADMAKLLPHAGGDGQWLVHRVRSSGLAVPEADLGGPPHPLPPEAFEATAVYAARLCFAEPMPPTWSF